MREGWENRYRSLVKVGAMVRVLPMMRRLIKKMQKWLYSIKLKKPLMTKHHPYLSPGSSMDQQVYKSC